MAAISAVTATTTASPASAAPPPSTGDAWPSVEAEIDTMFEDFVDEYNLPGASVAASKDDQLVVSKGYGYANTDDQTLLESDHQILMGSTTKALITGPTVIKAMEESGLELDSLIYGEGGIYGTRFDEDIAIGAAATNTPSEWYHSITVQHLLDHAAGFGNADTQGAKDLFDAGDDEVTYELVHRHFLQTAGLKFEPGTNDDYSNHHFGSMKLLIEELTGEDAADYSTSALLEPMGLSEEIEPVKNEPKPTTANNHKYVDKEPVPYTPNYDDSLGFHAGGYRSSAQDVVELMTELADSYTPSELDRMGFGNGGVSSTMQWGDTSTAYVSHGGRVAGGSSFVAMTVDGINIAIQSNINNKDARVEMASLFKEVAELLRDSEVPKHHDIWEDCTLPEIKSGYSQVARHGIAASAYQCTFDQLSGSGYELDWIDVSHTNGRSFFNVVFVPKDGEPWRAFHGYTGPQYQDLFDEMVEKGFAPAQIDSYPSSSNGVLYAGYFKKSGANFSAYHGLTASQHQTKFDDLKAKGFSPTSLSVVPVNGQLTYTGVYEKNVPGSYFVKSQLTPGEYQKLFDQQRREGRSPMYLNGYNDNLGKPRIVAVFRSEPTNAFIAKHGMSSAQYQNEWDQNQDDGFRTDVVTAYETTNRARFAAVWRKP